LDADGNLWRCCSLGEGLDVIEAAINGEAATLTVGLSGVDQQFSDLAWEDEEAGNVIGGTVRVMIQPCDDADQPLGDPEVKFTGRIDNIVFQDAVSGDNPVRQVSIECVNRFSMRNLTSGVVLSDTDQRARSAILNPSADPDKFAERVPGLSEKSVVW